MAQDRALTMLWVPLYGITFPSIRRKILVAISSLTCTLLEGSFIPLGLSHTECLRIGYTLRGAIQISKYNTITIFDITQHL